MSELCVPELTVVEIPSSMDAVAQPIRYFQAAAEAEKPRPLLVVLHTWGGTYDQNTSRWAAEAAARNWHFIQPHFRGPNVQPEACASSLAKQDVLDAIDWATATFPVDEDRIYIGGGSGGGHMTMAMIGHAPDRFAAASAWCGITDLAAWHRECTEGGRYVNYAHNIEACVGGAPGSSDEVDQQLRARSPLYQIDRAKDVPVDFNHGIHDGVTGSVPFHHTIDAFNRIAQAHGTAIVTDDEVSQLREQGRLAAPTSDDLNATSTCGSREIFLRRFAGPSRLTIFDGGHEIFPSAACGWLAQYSRAGQGAVPEAERALQPYPIMDVNQILG